MPDQNQILFQTKLRRPPIIRGIIERPRLLERLNRGINCPLTLVIASAGFGKTTLVANWLELMAADQSAAAASFLAAWFSLDENDNDLELFLRYFIAALRTIFEDACEKTLALLQARQPAPTAVLYASLSNEIEQLPGDCILVLDDYHTIRSTEVQGLLIEWARHWPKRLHLLLISRINPSIPLAKLRARGMVSEIRTQDLRFTTEQTAVYLNQAQFFNLSQTALHLLDERFEGWIAGLHLAALSLRSADSQEAILSVLSGENAIITDYLVDEVLSHQFPAIQTFLLRTSILPRLTASLCEAVVGEVGTGWNVRACLDWIERSELFISPLDNKREWYRFHQLFQELLQKRLSAELPPDQVADLHRLASAWFEEHGLVDEALHHALTAGDLDLAGRQMYAALRDVLNLEDRPTLERWLRQLPEDMIQYHPELLMIRVWTLQFSWRLELQAQALQQVEVLLDSDVGAAMSLDDLQILRGQILGLKAQHAFFSNQNLLAVDLCRQVFALLPPLWIFVRGGAMLFLGMSMQANGQFSEAERMLLDEYESYGDKIDSYSLFLLLSLGFIYLNSGQLEQTRQIAQVLLQTATLSRIIIMQNWGDWFLGVVYYQCNQLEAAALHFSHIIENRYTAQITTYRDAVAGLAMIHQIKGESAEAWQLLETISQFDLVQKGCEDKRTCSLRARLQLMQGDQEGACRWVDTLTDPPPDQPLLWLLEPQVTRARILVARGTHADLNSAKQILGALDEIVERTHNTRYKIVILALRSMTLASQGETGAANAALKQALNLAHLGGFTRVFVDLGSPMQAMLCRLPNQDHSTQTIHHILAEFPAEYSQPQDKIPVNHVLYPSPGNSTLVESLTPREYEVLVLLREPLSSKEIARKLNISYATVKRHISTIYGKLDVHRRWDAVARAEALRILPPR